ncbi:hypothetical protein L2E82_30598 [Cichorium intybus]|uniref:Uncharacterized protein n=1 Tax=Cichorium intybus TaxID=13427 RepID=A0ACB9D0Y6_CICIN|nr:hypothetical protein L2E82_30598 [Cichorium intybus]
MEIEKERYCEEYPISAFFILRICTRLASPSLVIPSLTTMIVGEDNIVTEEVVNRDHIKEVYYVESRGRDASYKTKQCVMSYNAKVLKGLSQSLGSVLHIHTSETEENEVLEVANLKLTEKYERLIKNLRIHH